MSLQKMTKLDQEEKVTKHVYLNYPTVKMNTFFPQKERAKLKDSMPGQTHRKQACRCVCSTNEMVSPKQRWV